MQHLRSLKWAVILLAGSFCTQALWAEAPTVGASVMVFSRSGATHLNLLENSQTGGGQATEVTASSGLMSSGFRLKMSATQMQRELSDYTLVDRDGTTKSLDKTFDGHEQMGRVGLDYVKGPLTIASEIGQTLTQSPLSQRQASLLVGYQFFDLGSQISLSQIIARQEQPLSYYIDPQSFAPKAQATQLNPSITKLSYDQVLSEGWKSQIHLLSGQRPEDRPRHLGAGVRTAYALGDIWAVHAGAETIRESRAESLKDSRGYLTLDEFDIGVAVEVTYNLVVRASVGTAIERESARGIVPSQTVGTDKFDFHIEYRKSRLLMFVQGNIQESNTEYKGSSVTGGATWEI